MYIQLDLCEFKLDLYLPDKFVHQLMLDFVALQHAGSESLSRSSVLAERVHSWKCVCVDTSTYPAPVNSPYVMPASENQAYRGFPEV